MKTAFATLILALFAGVALAQQKPLAEFSWQALAAAGQLKTGTVVTLPDKTVALKIENPDSQPFMATVLIVDQPKITGEFYTLSGDVRYEGVEGDGYLEMWNHFGDTEAYFSRTLSESGPMGKLRGTSDWRSFILPFNATGAKSHPTKLVVNVNLPGKGVVYLRSPLKLAESARAPGASVQPGAWWSDRTGGLVGGIIGGVGGCLGALIGWLSSRGKARGFVLGSTMLLIVIGAFAMVAGLVAVSWRQPYAVWYPLLLAGVILVVLCPVILRRCLHRYREIELRRMTSMDAA
jgi:hypothetical protein